MFDGIGGRGCYKCRMPNTSSQCFSNILYFSDVGMWAKQNSSNRTGESFAQTNSHRIVTVADVLGGELIMSECIKYSGTIDMNVDLCRLSKLFNLFKGLDCPRPASESSILQKDKTSIWESKVLRNLSDLMFDWVNKNILSAAVNSPERVLICLVCTPVIIA